MISLFLLTNNELKMKNKILIAVTTQAIQENRQKCLDADAQDYLKKPIDVDMLVTAIKSNCNVG